MIGQSSEVSRAGSGRGRSRGDDAAVTSSPPLLFARFRVFQGNERRKDGAKRREEKSKLGREGWTDGGVGPQRHVIHHTAMRPALVQHLFPCRSRFPSSSSCSIFLSLLSSLHLLSCFHTRHSLRDFDIISLFPPSTDNLPRVAPSSLSGTRF